MARRHSLVRDLQYIGAGHSLRQQHRCSGECSLASRLGKVHVDRAHKADLLYQGFIVACPVVFHEFTGPDVIPYDGPGTDRGNEYKVKKLLSAYDEDARKAVDLLADHPNCTGRIGSTGMCLGGHLAFRVSVAPAFRLRR